jgi:ferrous iron transport protein A
MELDQADELACHLEHSTSVDLADRLAAFLGNPQVCYHGDPIPQMTDAPQETFRGIPLQHVKLGQTSPVMRINGDAVTEKYLIGEGIRPGARVRPLAVGKDGDMLLECPDGRLHLSTEMVAAVIVGAPSDQPLKESEETSKMVPLSTLKVGERGVIDKIKIKGATRQRLMAMGLVVGETILVKRVAPLGDPIDFVIKGYDLSLRKTEAGEIMVNPVKQGL